MHILIIKTSAEIREIENKKVIEKNQQKVCFLEINKIDKLLAIVAKREDELLVLETKEMLSLLILKTLKRNKGML